MGQSAGCYRCSMFECCCKYGHAELTKLRSAGTHVQVDSLIVLLDCGWDDAYDMELLKPISDVLDRIDCVLLSHPNPAHLGALPYLVLSPVSILELLSQCTQ